MARVLFHCGRKYAVGVMKCDQCGRRADVGGGPAVTVKHARDLDDAEAERLGLGRWVLCTATETRQCDICTNRLLRGGAQARRLRPPSIVCLECAKDDLVLRDAQAFPRGNPSMALTIPDIFERRFGARGTTLTGEVTFQTHWVPPDKETGQSPAVTEHWFACATAAEVRVDRWNGRAFESRISSGRVQLFP